MKRPKEEDFQVWFCLEDGACSWQLNSEGFALAQDDYIDYLESKTQLDED